MDTVIQKAQQFETQKAAARIAHQMRGFGDAGISGFLMQMGYMSNGHIGGRDMNPMLKSFERGAVAQSNALARKLRRHDIRKGRLNRFPEWSEGMDAADAAAIRKAALDVGSLTDLSQFTGGQTLGFVSWDTKLARGTVRPRSFTLYNYLKKTVAGNIVDYWTYVSNTGGQLPGAAYSSYGNQTTGTIAINAGDYSNKFINLKLAVDGRAITMALAQQNSFVDVADQESANAALNILQTVNWSAYWGNPDLYPNQQKGIAGYIPEGNVYDFEALYTSPEGQATGDSREQYLFDLLYKVAGQITNYGTFGQITHAFMDPPTIGDLQRLTTTQLRNIANPLTREQFENRAIVVNGLLEGMATRFGDIAFPIDMFISARDTPAQAMVMEEDSSQNMAQAPTVLAAPASVSATAAVVSGASGGFAGPYAAQTYVYAVATTDENMNESVLAYSAPIEVAANESVTLTITPGTVGTPAAFRVYRSGAGYNVSTAAAQNPAAFRHIADVPALGSPVTFTDSNAVIPGASTLFLLDLDEDDDALDYRTMLPLSKIELFAQNLYMPWALAHIGAIRPRVPKWHAMIRNYPSDNPNWSPLSPNLNAAFEI